MAESGQKSGDRLQAKPHDIDIQAGKISAGIKIFHGVAV
jgi:hypothetical protein